MGLIYSPKIVTDGLVLCLDAGSPKSYSGSGTTWVDRSGNGNNGTLVNGVSAVGGAMVFDGVNDYVTVPSNNYINSNDFTISLWMYFDNISSTFTNYAFLDKNVYNTSGISMAIGTGGSVSNRLLSVRYSTTSSIAVASNIPFSESLLSFNNWHNIVVIFYYSAPLSQYQLHIDKSLVGTSSSVSGTFVPNSTTLSIGKTGPGNGVYHKGKISSYQIYNRALSPEEILQNYNATKSRFGL